MEMVRARRQKRGLILHARPDVGEEEPTIPKAGFLDKQPHNADLS